MQTIEFLENEEYCRYNGMLCDESWYIDNFGLLINEIYHTDKYLIIETEDKYYIKAQSLNEAFYKWLLCFSRDRESYHYDNILDEEHGFSKKTVFKEYCVDEDTEKNINSIELWTPDIINEENIEKYLVFQTALDNYYSNLHKH